MCLTKTRSLVMEIQRQLSTLTGLVGIAVIWKISGILLRRHFIRKYTVVQDIPHIAKERDDHDRIKGTAVVCGGSIAGLLTARICANHFEKVTIVEPEAWLGTDLGRLPVYDEKGELIDSTRRHKRARIEQYDAVHAFLSVILATVTTLFPGFDNALLGRDGRIFTTSTSYMHARNGRIFRNGDWPVIFASRELFERLLRDEVLKHKRIRQIIGTVTGIGAANHNCTRINEVIVRRSNGTDIRLPASLVADCTGVAQSGYKWLKRLDKEFSPRPHILYPVSIDDLKLEYKTSSRARKFRFYVPPEARSLLPIPGGYDHCGWVYAYLPEPGVECDALVINRIEGHRFEILCNSRSGDIPSTYADIRPFVESLSSSYEIPDWVFGIIDVLLRYTDLCEDLGNTGAVTFSWIRYEKAPFIPSNLVAVGDAVMRVNPIYGQGISKASQAAVMLDSMLRKKNATSHIPDGFGRKFAELQSQKTKAIWDNNKAMDYQWSSTTPVRGERLTDAHRKGKSIEFLTKLCVKDDFVDRQMTGVRTFMCPPTDMLHPKVLLKMAAFWIQTKLGLV